ncbi:hypothetical protein BCEN4_350168 [Burkholderia cenocepacia]|nr:hypothetical protein BCEN4_350168 [Burkholderia cenocepacia]
MRSHEQFQCIGARTWSYAILLDSLKYGTSNGVEAKKKADAKSL